MRGPYQVGTLSTQVFGIGRYDCIPLVALSTEQEL